MKYDASNIVVSVGRRGRRQGRLAGLAALKLIDRDEACVSPDEATPEVQGADRGAVCRT